MLHQPSYLSALFKQETGSTLIDYINTQRVNRAAQLLVQNNHTIAAVAEEVGILDVNYFTKIFKKTLGVTPTRYRREHKEKVKNEKKCPVFPGNVRFVQNFREKNGHFLYGEICCMNRMML